MTDRRITAAIEAHRTALAPLADVEWRPGRSNPCNLYAKTGERGDWKDDVPIGSLATQELAEEACVAHNADVARRRAARRGASVTGGQGLQFGDGCTQNNSF